MRPPIPLLNSKKSVLLSEQDMAEIGFPLVAFCLTELLIKPGLKALLASKNPRRLLSIEGPWIADLSALHYSPDTQSFSWASHYDGSKYHLAYQPLIALLKHLECCGLVVSQECALLFQEFELIDPAFIEIKSVEQACFGQFWDGKSYCDISQVQYRLDVSVLVKDCLCKTCLQPYTKSYLHHLYSETPLLAQRYLAIHNLSCLIHR